MARFMVKANEYKNVCKAVNDRKLAELKKEIIEILKKQDEKEFKKAVDLFESQELHYTHLEKSLVSGKWIEKAGYGIGTVRIWKGKKYKKIAPGKWARVFDKDGRGTNIAIGKLIARDQKIDNVEDLMAFVMANKQRFVDENGVDLPVLDKLRAAVDAKNNGDMGSSKTNEKKTVDYSKMSEDELKELTSKLHDKLREKDYDEVDEEMEQINAISKQQAINFYKTREKHTLQHVEDVEQKKKMIADSKAVTEKELARKEKQKAKETNIANKNKLVDEVKELKHKISAFEQIAKELDEEKPAEKKEKNIETFTADDFKNASREKLYDMIGLKYHQNVKYKNEIWTVDAIAATGHEDGKFQLALLQHYPNGEIKNRKYITALDIDKVSSIEEQEKPAEKEESEAEKHQNRSEAMKGNQNAKKYGLTDEQIERYDIQEVVEDVNGYGIVKNSEGKYSYIDDGRVKDRPDDFETSIEKVKERINDTYETKKNIQAAKDYDFKNANLGSDIEYSKRSDGRHMYFKKSPDGSKAISVTVEVSDMREPLNMTYEVSDTKSGESWQYETAYGNKEGLEWAVERPEQMEKELKKFFKRDPEKEWNKQNTTDSITNFESEGKVVSYDDLQPIATNKSVGENEVQMPYSKDLADEIESLKNCAAPEWKNREFMKHVYYDDGNLVTTDGRRLKIVKVGKLDGIQDGTYVDITTDKSGINIKKRGGMEDYRFPTYKKVMPDNLSQNVTLDSKLVKEKIKSMQKDGAIDKKGANIVQLEFRDGKVFIDDTPVGNAKDIKMKYGEGWGPANEETNFMAINADYLVNALSGKTSVLQIGERADKAIAINTGSTSNILMPMSGTDKKMDYSKGRQAKKENDEYKANAKQKAQDALNSIVDTQKDSMNNEWVQSLINKVNNKEMENHKTIIEHAYKALKDAEKMIEKPTKKWTSSLANNKYGYSLLAAVRKNPEFKTALENMAMEYGLIKKSLFDDFIVDVFEANDEEEIEDELYEGETEYNDYSAEQPELFNSTAMKVQEAMNRCNIL